MPFEIDEHKVRGAGARHRVMVITPKAPMIIGRKRIDDLRKPSSISRVERWLIEQARKGSSSASIVLFRAVNDAGERVWQFDPALSQADLEDGGYVMSRALLPFHRRLMASGVVLMVHTDWGIRECYAMRTGVERAIAEQEGVEKAPPAESNPTREADRWVLRHMLLHAALDLDHVLKTLLPGHLSMVERRLSRVRELVAQLPADAIS
jgi:hypothetical protein